MSRILQQIIHRMVVVAGFCLTSILAAAPAHSGIYDDTDLLPGDIISNSITVRWGDTDSEIPPEFAKADFVLSTPDLPGNLTAHEFDPNSATEIQVFEAFYQGNDGSFDPAGPPKRPDGSSIPPGSHVPMRETDRILKNTTLFLVLDDPAINIDGSQRDTAIIEITDSTTGDTETYRFTETGEDTGAFAGYIETSDAGSLPGDGLLATRPHSRITSRHEDPFRPDRSFEASVLVGPVDPLGILFDSRTGQPVNGVEITIINTDTGKPAEVFGSDLKAIYPSTITTGSTVTDSSGQTLDLGPGEYRFPFVNTGEYRFEVSPPRGFAAPSLTPDSDIQALPGAPFSLDAGSRLGNFGIEPGPPIEIDIPLDGSGLLNIAREGSDDALEIGDFIEFKVSAGTNTGEEKTADIIDRLPRGLKILPETVRIDGDHPDTAPAISKDGRNIVFADTDIPASGVAVITYVAQVVPGAPERGTLRSSSRAEADRLVSNTALHDLDIIPVFGTTTDTVIGQVVAGGCSGRHDPDRDLSGIRVMLGDGNYVDTDSDGRFTFRKVMRGTHIVSLDPLSLPRGTTATLCENSTRKAGSAWSRFIEARGGMVRQVRFHIKPERITDHPDPIAPEMPESEKFDSGWLEANPDARGLLFPANGMFPKGHSIDIVSAHAAGTSVKALINGTPVGNIHKRPAVTASGTSTRLTIWKGISIDEGKSRITLVANDANGREIRRETHVVDFNNTVDRMSLVGSESVLVSNGQTRPVITLRITDEDGTPLHPGAIVNVNVSRPYSFSQEERTDGKTVLRNHPSASGIVDPDGLLRLRMSPARRPGMATFSVPTEDGAVSAEAFIRVEDRPWVLVGMAEGTLSERAISEHMRDAQQTELGNAGNIALNGRTALYAQGVIKGKWLVTARYDSAIAERREDFFDIDPESDYIVYGDQSTEGDAASSRDPLYLRISGPPGEFLYGDFDTNLDTGQAEYTRRLTGARALFGNDVFTVMAFASDTSQRFVEDRFAADGTSGPFDLSNSDVLPNSERVTIETEDRDQPDKIIHIEDLRRGRDYDIDYNTGRIFLAEPLPSRDRNLNPRALIVEYEMDSPEDNGLVVGGRIEAETENARYGVTAVREDNIGGGDGTGTLLGLDAARKLGPSWLAETSIATSHQEDSGTLDNSEDGFSTETRLSYRGEYARADFWLRSETTDFGIQNQETTSDTVISSGASGQYILSQSDNTVTNADGEEETQTRTRAIAASMVTEHNLGTGEETTTTEGSYIMKDGNRSRTIGFRAQRDDEPEGSGKNLKIFGKSAASMADDRLRFSLAQEISLARSGDIDDPDLGILEAEWDATEALTLRFVNEIETDDDITANIVSFSADYHPWKDATITTGAVAATSGHDTQTVGFAGIDQGFEISKTTSFNIGIEHQGTLDGEDGPVERAGISNPRLEESFTALTAGLNRNTESWEFDVDGELRESDTSRQARARVTATRPVSRDIDAGLQASLFGENRANGDNERDHDLKASIAWRPRDRKFALVDSLRARYDETTDISKRLRVINSLQYSRILPGNHQINLRHGIKYSSFDFTTGREWDVFNMFGIEYRHNLNEWLDMGLHGSAMHGYRAEITEYSAGASLGFTPFDNGWVSVGYNWAGYEDDDFSESGYTSEGAFVQFRVKIDSATIPEILK